MLILRPVILIALLVAAPAPPAGSELDQCADRLKAIGHAVRVYRQQHGNLPDNLTELVPPYLPDRSSLHCAADHSPGSAGDEEGHADPFFPISYSYEMRGIAFPGLASRPGVLPQSDLPGHPWGTERSIMLWLGQYYGPRVPMVRCYHHRTAGEPLVLNLTIDGEVVRGGTDWRNDTATITDAARRALSRFEADARRFERDGTLDWLSDYILSWDQAAQTPECDGAIRRLADGLVHGAATLKHPATAYRMAARLALVIGDFPGALADAQSARGGGTD